MASWMSAHGVAKHRALTPRLMKTLLFLFGGSVGLKSGCWTSAFELVSPTNMQNILGKEKGEKDTTVALLANKALGRGSRRARM